MIMLGVETSCDETACAIVENGLTIRSSKIYSQISIHKKYGGVVPELASRAHLEKIIPVLDSALSEANVSLADISGIAVTRGPGLVGSLLVGFEGAKTLGALLNIPVIPVCHTAGHLYSPFLENPELEYPYLGLVISGGHSSLVSVYGPNNYKELGETLDDAAGEAFDKVAQLLGLPYPGGPAIEKAAKTGDETAIHFPRPLLKKRGFNFSFSGLKTAVLNYVKENPDRSIPDVAASFQKAAIDVLLYKTKKAAEKNNFKRIAITGGVACNGRLKNEALLQLSEFQLFIPSPKLATDNAAMIAGLGYHLLKNKMPPIKLKDNVKTNFPLSELKV